MRMNFKWQPMIPNFHLKQQKGELTLPQTSQRKNVAGQKDLGEKSLSGDQKKRLAGEH